MIILMYAYSNKWIASLSIPVTINLLKYYIFSVTPIILSETMMTLVIFMLA